MKIIWIICNHYNIFLLIFRFLLLFTIFHVNLSISYRKNKKEDGLFSKNVKSKINKFNNFDKSSKLISESIAANSINLINSKEMFKYTDKNTFIIDYIITKRNFKMEINEETPCNVNIIDKLSIRMSRNTTFIEHLLVRNNSTKIIPVNAYTNANKETGIIGYDINQELFVANLYLDNKIKLNNDITKSKILKKNDYSRNKENDYIEFDVVFEYIAYGLTDIEYFNNTYYNKFIWKFINENNNDVNYNTIIDININFLNNNNTQTLLNSVQLINNTNAKKSKELLANNTVLKYQYIVDLTPQELHTLNLSFLYLFNKCKLPLVEVLYNNLFGVIFIVIVFLLVIIKCYEDKPIKLNLE